MKSSFQAGVDSIYNAIVGQGVTPAGKTPAQLVTAVGTLATNKYNAGHSAGYNSGYAAGKANFGITVEKVADGAASAGFTGTYLVSTDNNGSLGVSHGYHGAPMNLNWSTGGDGAISITVRFGGYGTIGANIYIRPRP